MAKTFDTDLAIIIVSYNVDKYLIKCLMSLKEFVVDQPFKLVVVDNNSTDKSAFIAKDESPDCTLIVNEKNIGFGRAVNLAASTVYAKHYLILNPDTEVINDIINKMMVHLRGHKSAGLVGCRMLNTDGTIQPHSCSPPGLTIIASNLLNLKYLLKNRYLHHLLSLFRWTAPVRDYLDCGNYFGAWKKVQAVPGSCFLVEGELFHKIGGFDESIFLYYEDADLFYRIINHEKREIHLLPDTGVIHHCGKSFSTSFTEISPYKYWSLLYYVRKNSSILNHGIVIFLLLFTTIIKFSVKWICCIKKLNHNVKYLNDCVDTIKICILGLKSFDPFRVTPSSTKNAK